MTGKIFVGYGAVESRLPLLLQGQKNFVVTDSNVYALYPDFFQKYFEKTPIFVLQAGEENKTFVSLGKILSAMTKAGLHRTSRLFAVGGGVIGDIGGFAAATYMRGIRFVNIPTTLLAMVDASSGGKTGFDYQGVKNLIGTFTPPLATLIYPDLLRTLPTNELLSGFAEMLKHALIASKEEWVKLLQIAQEELAHDPFIKALENTGALQASMAIKENVVAQDPCETGWRKILNFGHTIGHAIESAALEHDALPHGYCVLWGMVAEVYLSVVKLGCPREVLQQLTQVMLGYYGRPQCNCKQREELIQRMYHDKKNTAHHAPNFTLLRAVGEPVINQHVSEEDIDEALEYLFSL